MRWTEEQLRAYENRFKRLRPTVSEPVKRSALVGGVPREVPGRIRSRIRFTVYAVRPCDWDGYSIKPLQDCLVRASILHGDDWDLLQGEVISEKVHSKEEERTEITITAMKEEL